MSNSNVILYGLSCQHAAPGAATLVNGTLFCAWCQEHNQIVRVIEYEWHARCSGCNFGRWTGLSRHNADLFITRHVLSTSHSGFVEYARNPVATATAEKMAAWNGR